MIPSRARPFVLRPNSPQSRAFARCLSLRISAYSHAHAEFVTAERQATGKNPLDL
jgi:hypothetical protein